MNFTAHYFTLQKENSYIVLGAIIPDVANDFSRIYNYAIEDKFIAKLEINKLLFKGFVLHMKGDDIFHNHILFDEMQTIAKRILNNTFETTLRRKYVIAHVLIELLIDQNIILNNPKILANFYKKLEEINIKEVNKFFKTINIDEKTSHFQRNFTNFMKLKFLYRLKENEGVIFTLDKVFAKKLKHDFIENKEKWNFVIEKIKKEIANSIPLLLEDVKQKMYE